MELKSLHMILFFLSAEVSTSRISLKFVDSYMTKYNLKFPLFILHPSDLDTFFEDMTIMKFQTFSSYCYEEGIVTYTYDKQVNNIHAHKILR